MAGTRAMHITKFKQMIVSQISAGSLDKTSVQIDTLVHPYLKF